MLLEPHPLLWMAIERLVFRPVSFTEVPRSPSRWTGLPFLRSTGTQCFSLAPRIGGARLGSGSHSTKGGHDRYRPHRVHRISDLLDHNRFVAERSRPRDQAW